VKPLEDQVFARVGGRIFSASITTGMVIERQNRLFARTEIANTFE